MTPIEDVRLLIGRLDRGLDAQDENLDEITVHVKATSGRVTALEKARERDLGAEEAPQ
jgi:hypothetical protein